MWYEESAKTTLDSLHMEHGPMPNCECAGCTARREELPAKKIERMLRGIILALDGMTAEERKCVRTHLGNLREQEYPPETIKADCRTGFLCHLERYLWEGLHAH